jgi:hypothetical protein
MILIARLNNIKMDDREKGLRGAYQFIGVKYKLILYNYLLLKQFKTTKQEHEHNCK